MCDITIIKKMLIKATTKRLPGYENMHLYDRQKKTTPSAGTLTFSILFFCLPPGPCADWLQLQ